ncbi:MAG: hypothetical protein JW909_00545 [Planctomycetes bacterium]|nr:hypothetical protein [Planctomycetota bacterium]
MSIRRVSGCLLFALPVLLAAGCSRYNRNAESFEVLGGYWAISIETAESAFAGGDNWNLLSDAGLDDECDTYYGEFFYHKGQDSYGLGFGTWSSSGQATLGSDLVYGGTTFTNGSTVHSSVDMNQYRLIVSSREQQQTQQALSAISFVIEYLDFSIDMYDVGAPATRATFDDSAMMFLFGYAYEWGTGTGQVYFVDAKYMNLDWVRIGHTGGEYLDVTGGVKWTMGSTTSNSTIMVGYRYLDMDLDNSGDTLKFSMEGPVLGFTAKF